MRSEKVDAETRCWAWTSLVLGVLVILGAIGSFAWPVIIVELGSVIGSAMFLFGGESVKQTAVVLLAVAAVFECVGGGIFLLLAFYLLATPSGLAGWNLVLGIYALVFSVPVITIGAIDLYTVQLIRKSVFRAKEESGLDSKVPLNATPAVNLTIPAPDAVNIT